MDMNKGEGITGGSGRYWVEGGKGKWTYPFEQDKWKQQATNILLKSDTNIKNP